MGINVLHRKEQLILTTIDIIDELGIQKLTTREIARRQEVSEATLFRHYKNKNELLIAVLDYFIQFDSDILQSTELNELKPTETLLYLITTIAEYYENYPAITSILQLFDVLRYEEELSDKIKTIQENRTSTLRQIIEAAKSNSEIPSDTDSEMMAMMISGFFREICLNWRLSNFNFSLRKQTRGTLEMLLKEFHK